MALITKGTLSRFAELRDASSGIPFDVTFQITNSANVQLSKDNAEQKEVKENVKVEKIVLGSVACHKFLLGAFSPVMKNMFYGSLPEGGIIHIEDTSVKAFEAMTDFIYQRDIDWVEFSIEDIFEIVYLAEKYQISDLLLELLRVVTNFVITEANFINIASTAAAFEHFKDVSSALFENCARFIRKTKITSVDLLNFAVKADVKYVAIVMKLITMASKLPALGCENCGVVDLSKCGNGKAIANWQAVRFGLRVCETSQVDGWQDEVQKVIKTEGQMVWIQNDSDMSVTVKNLTSLVYKCK